jgi:hypothetical protein
MGTPLVARLLQALTKRIEKRFRGLQIGGLEPFGEPPVDGGQHLARLGGPALPMVEPCEARGASRLIATRRFAQVL